MERKRILLLCFTELHKDPRVLRQAQALKDQYTILTAGATKTNLENDFIQLKNQPGEANRHFSYWWPFRKAVSFIILLRSLYLRVSGDPGHLKAYWTPNHKTFFKRLFKKDFDLVIANDLNTLPLAYKLAKRKRAKLLFDAHEYYPLEFENNPEWIAGVKPAYDSYCKRLLPEVDYFTVVSDTIGREYKKNFGVSYSVIDNAANYCELKPGPVDPGNIKIVHHGFAIPERKVENIIRMFEFLDERFTLHLVLVWNNHNRDYYEELKAEAIKNPRIKFHSPVPFDEIPVFLNQFDIGIHFWDVSNFNNYATIPNKFYEYLQARLMVGIGPSPELQRVVEANGLGVCAAKFDPRELSSLINALTAGEIWRCKTNADDVAYILSSETNKKRIRQIADELLGIGADS